MAGLFLVYKFGRQLATGRTAEAFRNAHHVWDWERVLHLPDEGAVQSLLLHGDTLVHVANTYYAAVHFPATLAFLVWLYLRRPAHYVWARRVLAAVTGAALVLHLLFPLAPPRMLGATGLLDTARRLFGPWVRRATAHRRVVEPVRGDALAATRLGPDAGDRPDRRDADAVALAVAAASAGDAAGRRGHREPLLAGRDRGHGAARSRAGGAPGAGTAAPPAVRPAPPRRSEVRRRSSAERPELVGAGR
ncbi:hypothetical protein SVIOM342S_01198 [Streptomyces violaceorubidus]